MADSYGILLHRGVAPRIEVLVAHPGGPLWVGRDEGAWSIPKGLADPGEEPLAAAVREFAEETGMEPDGPFRSLGSTRLASGKTVHAWAAPGDFDPGKLQSNTFTMEWPPRSGRYEEFPEIDRVVWVDPAEAMRRLNPAQRVFVARLLEGT